MIKSMARAQQHLSMEINTLVIGSTIDELAMVVANIRTVTTMSCCIHLLLSYSSLYTQTGLYIDFLQLANNDWVNG